MLDPVFKFYWIRDLKLPVNTENRLKQHIIQLILDEMSKDIKASSFESSNGVISSSSSSGYSSSSIATFKKRKLFSYHDHDDGIHSNSLAVVDPSVELNYYLSDSVKTKFTEYWLFFKSNILKKQVKKIFTVQASAAPIERIISYAGVILSSQRRNMSEQLFRDLVFLKANQSLLQMNIFMVFHVY